MLRAGPLTYFFDRRFSGEIHRLAAGWLTIGALRERVANPLQVDNLPHKLRARCLTARFDSRQPAHCDSGLPTRCRLTTCPTPISSTRAST
jgi:hypothetical protein